MTGDDFVALRHLLGLTQAQLGAQLGVHRNTVIRWERPSGTGYIPKSVELLLIRMVKD